MKEDYKNKSNVQKIMFFFMIYFKKNEIQTVLQLLKYRKHEQRQ